MPQDRKIGVEPSFSPQVRPPQIHKRGQRDGSGGGSEELAEGGRGGGREGGREGGRISVSGPPQKIELSCCRLPLSFKPTEDEDKHILDTASRARTCCRSLRSLERPNPPLLPSLPPSFPPLFQNVPRMKISTFGTLRVGQRFVVDLSDKPLSPRQV